MQTNPNVRGTPETPQEAMGRFRLTDSIINENCPITFLDILATEFVPMTKDDREALELPDNEFWFIAEDLRVKDAEDSEPTNPVYYDNWIAYAKFNVVNVDITVVNKQNSTETFHWSIPRLPLNGVA